MQKIDFSEGFLSSICSPVMDEKQVEKFIKAGFSEKASRTIALLFSAKGIHNMKEWAEELVEGGVPVGAAELMVKAVFSR